MVSIDEVDTRVEMMKARIRRIRVACNPTVGALHRKQSLREIAELAEGLVKYIATEVPL